MTIDIFEKSGLILDSEEGIGSLHAKTMDRMFEYTATDTPIYRTSLNTVDTANMESDDDKEYRTKAATH